MGDGSAQGSPDDGSAPAAADPNGAQPGLLVAGRYRLGARLGSGGFGHVWRAHDEQLNVDVAVKEVWLPQAMSREEHADRVRRAVREARHAARLRDHPGVVTVYDVVEDHSVPWTVMQLIHGRSLEQRIESDGPLSVQQTAVVAVAILGALSAAHEAGIIHRDVKPANVLMADDGRVLLADFGIAVQQESNTALTATGLFIGSVEYVAPERARGQETRPESDLFSLGATLYQAVEGVSPFRRATSMAALTAILFEEPPEPTRAGPLAPVLRGLLEKDPSTRTTVAQALGALGALENLATDGRGAARETPSPAPVRRVEAAPTAPAADQGNALTVNALTSSPLPQTRRLSMPGSVGSAQRRMIGALVAPVLLGVFVVVALLLPGVDGRVRVTVTMSAGAIEQFSSYAHRVTTLDAVRWNSVGTSPPSYWLGVAALLVVLVIAAWESRSLWRRLVGYGAVVITLAATVARLEPLVYGSNRLSLVGLTGHTLSAAPEGTVGYENDFHTYVAVGPYLLAAATLLIVILFIVRDVKAQRLPK